MQRLHTIFYAPSHLHGRGVFTGQLVGPGDVVEVCPVLILGPNEQSWIKQSELYHYYFTWGDKGDAFAIALGYGSLYNHAYAPNIEFFPDFHNRLITFKATQKVFPGEELLINYVEGAKRSDLWFDPREPQIDVKTP